MPRLAERPPPDQRQRDQIVSDLDRNMLVEASAGSGKTTSMVQRMVALLRQGRCSISQMAAMTFTRKAAAELRARFQVQIERTLHDMREQGSIIPRRLSDALGKVEQCFIGTIHSFCARLLRERPVEAGVDPSFLELDEMAEERLRESAWEEFLALTLAQGDPIVEQLADVGLELSHLQGAAERFADYGDIEEWPAPFVPPPDGAVLRSSLRQFHQHMMLMAEEFPDDPGNDKLMPLFRRLPRLAGVTDLSRLPNLMQHLEMYKSLKPAGIVQRNWPGKDAKAKSAKAKEELERWNSFVERHIEPARQQWRSHRYPFVLEALKKAATHFQTVREREGVLNFQDLLLKTRTLLKNHPHVREDFRGRLTHLLVDEFQDTDPLQAEVILYLTSENVHETDWRKCRPRPGALFVVGDPQQSIYRFRRADIVTYNCVKEIIQASGGEVVPLTTNFRSQPSLVKWVNGVFAKAFPAATTPQSPAHRLMSTVSELDETVGPTLHQLTVPSTYSNKDQAAYFEAMQVAQVIRKALLTGLPLDDAKSPGSSPPVQRGAGVVSPKPLRADDFLIVTWNRARLSYFGMALDALGIPYQSAGSTTLNEMPELRLLCQLLEAITRPDDPVALIAVLRGELFGFSDPLLYAYHKAGGRFDWSEDIPKRILEADRALWQDALLLIRRCASWWQELPPIAAVERIIEETGLLAWPGLHGVSARSTLSLDKVLMLMRREAATAATKGELVIWLRSLVEKKEKHDSLSPPPRTQPCVRLMNLHKVKGLEAPVVFLADTNGAWEPPVELHIDRSTDQTRGYLAVRGEREGFAEAPLLAHHPQWEEQEQAERAFMEAERRRLLYVAATRAGQHLIISQRTDEQQNDRNPWRFFHNFMTNVPELPPLPTKPTPQPEPVARYLTEEEITAGLDQIKLRWKRLQTGLKAELRQKQPEK
jgi:ATP-dependent helicase/nuclease subunit A